MKDAYDVGFKDGALAGYKLAIEDMKLDKKPQIMKKYEGDYATLLARHDALRDALKEILNNCNWEEVIGHGYAYLGSGDNRIGIIAKRALAEEDA